ncbi:MAG TPA: Spy/CpxP family protein refolding chaperone [Pseudolabrys sp.]|nr:Spy/CpxP family protein refolding chaperone [Pseudolabrys sp.]
MRGSAISFTAVLGAAILLGAGPAYAQLSPEGILGGVSRPFRHMLGHFGHIPRKHRHRAHSVKSRKQLLSRSASPEMPEPNLTPAGPLAWPTAYEEILGFAFWPDDYGPRIRGRGFGLIAATMRGRFSGFRSRGSATTGAAAKNENGDPASSDRCANATNSISWPAVQLKQTVQFSDAQEPAVTKLQEAVSLSYATITSECREAAADSVPERLRRFVQAIWAVRDAAIYIREPVKQFYSSLSDDQKKIINELPTEGKAEQNRAEQKKMVNGPRPESKAEHAATGDNFGQQLYQACAAQNIQSAERLIQEIRAKVRPNDEQSASLENLSKVVADMAKLMIASCAQPVPPGPVARLDAAGDLLTALNYAASSIQIAFADFYRQLSDAQKRRLVWASR